MSVGALLGTCRMSQSALSQHLAVLRASGVVESRRSGKRMYYKIASPEYLRLAKLIASIAR